MKELTEEEKALKKLMEDTERSYKFFQSAFRDEIPREPTGPGDTRISRIEGLWHEMRKQTESLQEEYIESLVESCDDEIKDELMKHLKEDSES